MERESIWAWILGVVAALLLLALGLAQAGTYQFEDVGIFTPKTIDGRGNLAGQISDTLEAARRLNGELHGLGVMGQARQHCWDGSTVGELWDAAFSPHATMWDASGARTDLPELPGGTYSSAVGCSSRWGVGGFGGDHNGVVRALRWQHGEVMALPDAGLGASIMSVGQMYGCGMVFTPSGSRAAVWDHRGQLRYLLPAEVLFSSCDRVSDNGVIVGGLFDADFRNVPFTWDPRRGVIVLALIPDTTGCLAHNVDRAGIVTGYCQVGLGAEAVIELVQWHVDQPEIITDQLEGAPDYRWIFLADGNGAGMLTGAYLIEGDEEFRGFILHPASRTKPLAWIRR